MGSSDRSGGYTLVHLPFLAFNGSMSKSGVGNPPERQMSRWTIRKTDVASNKMYHVQEDYVTEYLTTNNIVDTPTKFYNCKIL